MYYSSRGSQYRSPGPDQLSGAFHRLGIIVSRTGVSPCLQSENVGNVVLSAAYFSPRIWFPLARPHIHLSPSKPYALSFQPQSLLDRRISGQLDLPPGSQHALPRQSKSLAQHARHASRRSWKSRRLRHAAIGRNLPARNCADRLLDAQSHGAGRVGFFLGFPLGDVQGIVVPSVGRCVPCGCPILAAFCG